MLSQIAVDCKSVHFASKGKNAKDGISIFFFQATPLHIIASYQKIKLKKNSSQKLTMNISSAICTQIGKRDTTTRGYPYKWHVTSSVVITSLKSC